MMEGKLTSQLKSLGIYVELGKETDTVINWMIIGQRDQFSID